MQIPSNFNLAGKFRAGNPLDLNQVRTVITTGLTEFSDIALASYLTKALVIQNQAWLAVYRKQTKAVLADLQQKEQTRPDRIEELNQLIVEWQNRDDGGQVDKISERLERLQVLQAELHTLENSEPSQIGADIEMTQADLARIDEAANLLDSMLADLPASPFDSLLPAWQKSIESDVRAVSQGQDRPGFRLSYQLPKSRVEA